MLMTSSNTYNNIIFRIKRSIGHHPILYYPLHRLLSKNTELAVNRNTELVIEGFPRSGNSFSVVAFEYAQKRKINIAHHLHNTSQIIKGIQLGIPVLVLLRNPESAICSFLIRENHLTIDSALWDYINFHKRILPYKDKFLIALFDDVISDYGKVISELNKKFGTEYDIFEHNEINVSSVFSRLDVLEASSSSGSIDEDKVARPSDYRARQTANIKSVLRSEKYSGCLSLAYSLYQQLARSRHFS